MNQKGDDGESIKEKRLARGMTLSDISKLTGLHEWDLEDYENGVTPTPEMLKAIIEEIEKDERGLHSLLGDRKQ